jgi:hypothetical protein
MVSIARIKELALSFSETDEHPHFDKTAFRVRKKIFATLDEAKNRVMVKLTPGDQYVYVKAAPGIIYPVPGTWGQRGATFVEISRVKLALFREALTAAYCTVAPKPLRDKFRRLRGN